MAEKRLRGRPESGQPKRTNRIALYVSDAEKDRLDMAAQRSGLSTAALIRLRALQGLEPEDSTTMTA
jgi:hypothetical protein